jgi:hypothetical protein
MEKKRENMKNRENEEKGKIMNVYNKMKRYF